VPAPSAEQLRRAAVIAHAPEFRARVGRRSPRASPKTPLRPRRPVEKQIYGGFYSHADKALLASSSARTGPDARRSSPPLPIPVCASLGRRLVAFHAPELLSAEERGQYQAWLRERWSAADAPETEWMTFEKCTRAIAEIESAAVVDAEMLSEIRAYVYQFAVSGAD
jgi:exodeoxyribonuclease I